MISYEKSTAVKEIKEIPKGAPKLGNLTNKVKGRQIMRASLPQSSLRTHKKAEVESLVKSSASVFFIVFVELRAGGRGAQLSHYTTALHFCQLANCTNLLAPESENLCNIAY